MRPFLFLGMAWAVALAARAGERRFSSGPARTSLIELYTSEGCSSCPPAERWLGGLRDQPGLWRDFVPIEFHVNYWDRLGWPDRFATKEFTQRQYAHAAGWAGGSVYTPCFVRDGLEWHAGQDLRPVAGAAVGTLVIVLGEDDRCRVEFIPVETAANRTTYEVHVAWLAGDVTSRVTAGENRGETLRHEFVALTLTSHDLAATTGVPRAEFSLPRPTAGVAPRRALAAWVTRRGELAAVQATGGWVRE